MGEKDQLRQEVIAAHANDNLCAMLTQAHKTKQQQDQPQNHNGPLQRVQEATKLNAETRDPPSQDPRDHKEQPSRHNITPRHFEANTDNAGSQRKW